METEVLNTRVLIIDDEEIVRDNIEDILVPKRLPRSDIIDNASRILFDKEDDPVIEPFSNYNLPVFRVDKAINGMDGLEKVKSSIAENAPYAVVFLDMRMPGWDGLETALHIRKVDTMAEIIIVTAYSDRSIKEIIAKAGQGVGYHVKPYATEEIFQLATKAVNDYNKLRSLEKLISVISDIDLSEKNLNPLLKSILDQLAIYLGCESAMLGIMSDDKVYKKLFSIGLVEKDINSDQLSQVISSALVNKREVEQLDDIIFVKLEDYAIFAILNKGEHLKTEKLYLVKLFVESAAKAIKNTRLHEELRQKEKLSTVGKALSMLIHDLRTPILNISELTTMIREEGAASELLDLIDLCGQQASAIFDDFLDFINETPLKFQPVSVEQLIEDSILLTRRQDAAEDISISKDIEPALFIQGDSRKLKRVIINLVNNAVEVLKDHHVENGTIAIKAWKTGDSIFITVQDNGPGVPEKIMATLFEAFVTTGKSNGTGLGLAIVKQCVIAHGGKVSLVNDAGALFTIQLPLAH